MTLEQAFEQLINSHEFKEAAKVKDSLGGKYRSYMSLFKKGSLKTGAMATLLKENGYEIRANKIRKK